MANSLNITNIPAPRVPFIDERTGLMAREWYRFFLNLFVLTGSGNNPVSLEELQLGPPNQPDLTELLIQINQNIAPQYEDQSGDFLATLDTAQLMSMMSRFENAEAAIQGAYLQPVVQTGTIANYNLNGSPTLGGVAYGTGPALAVSAAGSAGQVLTSAGAAAPTWAMPTTGTVSSVSVVSANGLAGTVATATTTPAITLSTTITGLLKGNGTAISAAVSGTDYAPATSGSSILYGNGAGGFSNVTIGTGVSFAAGTLSATGSGGTVTSVTGTAPVVSSGGTTPAISMAAATASVNGYLTSTDWTTFNNKGSGTVTSVTGTAGRITSTGGTTPVIDLASGVATAGTTGSVSLIPVVTIDTYGRVTGITTAANPQGTVTSVTGTSPVASSGGATPAISMPAATTSVSGYLTSTDWTTFNNKGSGTVTSVSGTAGRITSTGGTTPVIDLVSGIATPGTTGSVSLIPVVTIDTYGRVTSITTAANPQGTVTSVSGTGTVNGITLSGTVTSTGSLTLGGTLSGVSLATQVTGNLPVTNLNSGTSASALTFWRGDGSWATPAGAGTVTSVAQSFTGGLISVSGSPIITSGTLALTVAGTSGGIPYFSSASTWATSAALAAGSLVQGGGAGVAPSTITTGTGVVTALGVNTGTAGAFVVNGGALGTPSSGSVTNLTGTASININGTVGATTPTTGSFTTMKASTGAAVGGATPGAGGVAFPATAVAVTDVNTLDDYEEYTSPSTACTGALTNAVVWKAVKVGNLVTLVLPNVLGTTTNVAAIRMGVDLPAGYWPSASVFPVCVQVQINGAVSTTPGMIGIGSGGAIQIYRDATAAGWGTAGNSGFYDCCVSWVV